MSADELHGKIAELVSDLPLRQREVFVLHTYEGLSYAEVAEAAGISVANVRSHLHLARQRLRRQLEKFL